MNTDLDPSISAEEVAAAHDATPLPFPDVDVHDEIEDEVRGLIAIIPATPPQAMAKAKEYTDTNHWCGVGFCLKIVHEYFNVPALWPDAATAWDNAARRHAATPTAVPRGAVVYWTNGRHGHIALSVGGGLCRTTDYRRNGMVDLAPIANLASWCGGSLAGWGETLNGFKVWPDPKKPAPKAKPFDLQDRAVIVRAALTRAHTDHASKSRVDGLENWLAHIEKRIKDQKK